MKKILLALLSIVFAPALWAQPATDTFVAACGAQPSCVLASNVPWASGNQIWRFTAWQQNESIRVWILNRNPTSAHTTQTVQIFVTDDPTAPTLSNNADRWVQAAVIDNSVANAKCASVAANAPTGAPGANGKATCYSVGMYAVQIAVRVTGAASAAGSPDTFDIGVVQQASVYPGGPQPGNDPNTNGLSAVNVQIANVPIVQNGGSGTSGCLMRFFDGECNSLPIRSSAAEGSHVVTTQASSVLYSVYVTTGATAGFLMVFDQTTVPGDGAVTPALCVQAPANATTSVSYSGQPSAFFTTGIVVVFSSTGCFTKTISATAFFGVQFGN